MRRGAEIEDVGFEDANNTLAHVTARLNRKMLLDPNIIESALWSCTMMNERGEFWDAKGRDYDTFLKDLLTPDGFNKIYNTIERKK
jgi:hypothetical protein